MSPPLADGTALTIGAAFRQGADPVALCETLLERIDAQTSPVFLRVTRDRALEEARAAAGRYRRGAPLSPLDGVPIGWKDLIDMAGEVTTAGSDLYRDAAPATGDAPIVRHAASAGMVSLGKLNLTEFAYSGLGLNPHRGTPANPHDGARAPGGSSSGSAVAIASGLCPCAIGTDTGGSVRIPAAFNGLVGYKSSEGRIDKAGVFALSSTHDTVGPLARSVADCIALDRVLRARRVDLPEATPLATLTVHVPDGIVMEGLEDGVARSFERSLALLEGAGARIVRAPLPPLDATARLVGELGSITAAEAYGQHRALMESAERERVDRRVVDRILIGKAISAANLETLFAERRRLIAEVAATLDGALLLMPTAAHVAPPVAPLEADDDLFHAVNLKTLRNTAIGNFLDLPGLALPNGTDGGGMPTSLLVSTVGGDDDRLLAAGLSIEQALGAAQTHNERVTP